MRKRASLSEALNRASGRQVEEAAPAESQPPDPSGAVAPSRRGKKVIAGHFDRTVSRQLKGLALDHDTSVQALLGEAINDLFEKYGLPPIA